MASSKFVRRRLIALAAVLAIVGSVGFTLRSEIRSAIEALAGNDFAGTNSSQVSFVVEEGQVGSEVIENLVSQGIVKDYRLTLRLAEEQGTTFFPGTYPLKLEMKSLDALRILGNHANAIVNRVTIREGLRLTGVFEKLSEATGIPVKEFELAAKDLSRYQVGKGAPSLEGYLFPATYSFEPDATPVEILTRMNERMVDELSGFGVPQSDWHRLLTLASMVQSEARLEPDFYRVSRTFLNRIDVGMKLQSDATVNYGANRKTFQSTAEDRADSNLYNTYFHVGLPIGPISAPGRVAIDAALNPAKGDWLYFCTVNLATGETRFSNTYAEHQVAVREWRAWMKDNPGYE